MLQCSGTTLFQCNIIYATFSNSIQNTLNKKIKYHEIQVINKYSLNPSGPLFKMIRSVHINATKLHADILIYLEYSG